MMRQRHVSMESIVRFDERVDFQPMDFSEKEILIDKYFLLL